MGKQREFREIRDNTSVSWLDNSLCVTEENGALAICKVNLVHAVLLFEYLKPVEQQELQRCIIKIDFGPAHKKYSIIGRGSAQVKECLGEEDIKQKISNLQVGAVWYCETKKFKETLEKIEDDMKNDQKVPSYSSSGSGSNSSGRDKQYANCLTYAVKIMETYSEDLGIPNWNTPKTLKALPLPNIWIRVLHRTQKRQNS